jgi:cellulose synthase operon protein C
MSPSAVLKAMMLGCAVLALAACQDSAERAEAHYRNALALMAEGDTVRAALEFRNVFDNDGLHLEARETFARMLRETGDLEQSYAQYLRLVEQDPDNLQGRIALTEMALGFQNWEEVRRHGARVLALAPDAPEAPAIALNIGYLEALEAEDTVARREVLAEVQTRLAEDPDNFYLQRLALDGLVRDGDLTGALRTVDAALETDPGRRELHGTRLQILAALEQPEEIEAQILRMLDLFPGDEELQGMLLRYYVARGDTAAAQDFLVRIAAEATSPQRRHEALSALVQLRLENEGPDAAIAEIDRIIASGEDDVPRFRTIRASLLFDTGARAEAIAGMEAVLETDLPPLERGQFQIVLAQMLLADGNTVGAQRLVDTVLEADPGQTEALKMRAGWLIEDDATDRAIQTLRQALDESPDDAEAMTLMASAYARGGNGELAREFLALAAEASGGAPEETLRYARVLMEDSRYLLAEETLIRSLRLTPNHFGLLALLGEVYLLTEDWPRAEHVEQTLRGLDTGPATELADRMRAEILAGQGRTAEALSFLERVAGDTGDGNVAAQGAVISARLLTGDVAGAVAYAEDLIIRNPGDPNFRALLATVYNATGRYPEAEAVFRDLAGQNPEVLSLWVGLLQALQAQDRGTDARAALEEALTRLPDAPELLWAEASFLEREGDFEGAIAIYERLYADLSGSSIVANNLASLISTYRDDDASLERAYLIARRLQGSDVPAFQDTYGWIAYRRGQYDEALAHLEPAAAAMSDNALVQYHLGMTYLALGRAEEALAQLGRAVALAGPGDTRPQFERAREEIARLEAAPDAAEGSAAPGESD